MDILTVILALSSYIAGGIPSGYLIAKILKGIDIRQHGSGNPGAANVYRVVGKAAGVWTLLLDAFKGFFSVLAAKHFRPDDYFVMILCGALAIIGHIWTIFLKFRGGKGVATSAGVFFALLPKPMIPATLVFLCGTALSGHISVGSIAAAFTLPLFAWLMGSPAPLFVLVLLVCSIILIKHIPNIKRLLCGKELLYKPGAHLENSEKMQ